MNIQDKIITDRLGNAVEVSAFGSLTTSTPSTKIAVTFDTPLDEENIVNVTNTGAGTSISQHNGSLLKIQTNGTGSAKVETQNVLEYTAGSTGSGYLTVSFHGTMTANTKATIGLYDVDNGAFILGYNGTDFKLAYRNDNFPGNDVEVLSSNFNGDFDIANYLANDRTKIHRIRFKYGYLGVGDIAVEIKPDIPSRKWQTLHIFKTDGALTERTHMGTPILPITAEVSATNAEDIYMVSGSWSAKSYAVNEDVKSKKFFKRTLRPGVESGTLFALRNLTSFGGKTNKIRAVLDYIAFGTSSEGLYDVVVIKNHTSINGTFNAFKNDISVMEVNQDVTTYTGGEEIFSIPIGVGSSGQGAGASPIDVSMFNVDMRPGDVFLFIKDEITPGGGTDNNSLSIGWKERF